MTIALGSLLSNLSEYIDKASRLALLLFMAVMVAVMLAQVFARYVMQAAMPWPEELALFLMAWMTFIGSAIALKSWQHIGITLFANMLPTNFRKILSILVKVVVLFFAAFLIYTGTIFVQDSVHMVSDGLRVSMMWPRLSMPVGGIIMIIHTLDLLFKEVSMFSDNSEGA